MSKSEMLWIKLMKFGDKLGCHQMEERSFKIKKYQFPVCARCTGVIIGEIVSIILMIMKIHVELYMCISMLIPMGIDWGLQYLKIKNSNNVRRLITGLLGGFGLNYIYYYVLIAIINLVTVGIKTLNN